MYAVQWWKRDVPNRFADVSSPEAAQDLVFALTFLGWEARWWSCETTRTHAENYVTRYGGKEGKR